MKVTCEDFDPKSPDRPNSEAVLPPTVPRAAVVPVWKPDDCSWEELNESLRAGWDFTTAMANWCVHFLFRRDDLGEKTPSSVKLKSKSNPEGAYLYGSAVREFPGWDDLSAGIAASANIVTRDVHRKYLQKRFEIVVRKQSNLLTYRYPYPFPVHNQNWSVEFDRTGPVVSVPLPVLGRVRLRLKCGGEFRRQIGMLRQILSGAAKKGEAALYRTKKGQLLFKAVGTLPVRADRDRFENACYLHTDPGAFLVAEVNGRKVNISNGDHIKNLVARHRVFLQRTGEDKKREVRMDPRQRSNLEKAVDARCIKQNDRVKTHVEQVTSQVAKYCERGKVGVVVFDDSDRTFIPEGFPWHAFGERLGHKLTERGIVLVSRQNLDSEEFDRWRLSPTLVGATALAGLRQLQQLNRKGPHPKVSTYPPSRTKSASARGSTSSRSVPSSPPSAPKRG